MRKSYYLFFRNAFLLLLLFFFSPGCQEERTPVCARSEKDPPLSFSLAVPQTDRPLTRSVLTDPEIETKKTSVTLAAYLEGRLYASQYYSSGFSSMPLSLEKGYRYNIYALVNMGDQRSRLPSSEDALDTLTYRIPAYSGTDESVDHRGRPMAGKLEVLTVGTGSAGVQIVPVQRLLAKVETSFQCDWPGAVIHSAKVWNMNATLVPFGVSAVRSASDILPFQEIHVATSGSESTLRATFYVPENRQGTVEGITDSRDKSPDRNHEVDAAAAKLTYVEVSVHTGRGERAGDITYRSYLGANSTSDFNLERGYRYVWSLFYHADRTQDSDWKREGTMFHLRVNADRTTAYVGEKVRLTATLVPTGGAETDVSTSAFWEKQSGGSAALSIDSEGWVSATAAGYAVFQASYTLSGCVAVADSPRITFLAPSTPCWDDDWDDAGQVVL